MASSQSTFSILFLLTSQLIVLLNTIHDIESKGLFHMENTSEIIRKISLHNQTVSRQCRNELRTLINAQQYREPWALKGMLKFRALIRTIKCEFTLHSC